MSGQDYNYLAKLLQSLNALVDRTLFLFAEGLLDFINRYRVANDARVLEAEEHIASLMVFSRTANYYDKNGITAAVNLIQWRAPFKCEVTAVWGYRVGGAGATINARKEGASNHLAAALSLTAADQWMEGGAPENTIYYEGDKLEMMVVSVTTAPTQVCIQVDFRRIFD
jgi:hypothetical protein